MTTPRQKPRFLCQLSQCSLLAVNKLVNAMLSTITDLRRKGSPQGSADCTPRALATHILGQLGQPPVGFPPLWGSRLWVWNRGSPSHFPPPVLLGAEGGGEGEDTGQGGDDTAHVGQQRQEVLVRGVHLHGGDLGKQDRSGLLLCSQLDTEGLPRCGANLWSPGGSGVSEAPSPELSRMWSYECMCLQEGSTAFTSFSNESLTHKG